MSLYNVTRCINAKNGKVEAQRGLSEPSLLAWLADTIAKPNLKWFMVYEDKFDAELSTPKSWSTK